MLAGAGALIAGAGLVSGCENTTTPVATQEGSSGDGIMGDPTAGGPVDAAGIPLARRDYPVTLPRVGDAVKAGNPERGGELQIYNYADYLNPEVIQAFGKEFGVSVRVTTFQSLDEAFTKLSTGRFPFDVIFTAPDHLPRLVGRRLLQPRNPELIPNLRTQVWPELQSPFYDIGSRYTVPYTLYTTGIGWRNDKLGDFDPAALGWESFWRSEPFRGHVGVLDDAREGIGMALMYRGVTDLNTEDPVLLQRAADDLSELNEIARVKVTINGYETLPAGRMWLNQVWSGDMLNAVISYLPEGTSGDVLSYWFQKAGGPVFNDCMCIGVDAAKPVLAHRFLNYMLDPENALENFVGYVGYQPPITKIDADALFEQEILPPNLRNCVVTRDDYANGNAYLALTAEGRRTWDQSWAEFRNG